MLDVILLYVVQLPMNYCLTLIIYAPAVADLTHASKSNFGSIGSDMTV